MLGDALGRCVGLPLGFNVDGAADDGGLVTGDSLGLWLGAKETCGMLGESEGFVVGSEIVISVGTSSHCWLGPP